MNSRASISLSSLLFLLLISSAATAFNITQLLDQYPEFSTFNEYLKQTQLYEEINSRQTITVLAVENSALSSIAGRPLDEIKKILSLHVILDYYDLPKLKKISKKLTLLATLYQFTGQQGLLKVTNLSGGEISFRFAVKGSNLNATLVKSVAAQPYNISVLEISSVIAASGISEIVNISAPPSSASPAAAPKKAKAEAKVQASSPDADADADVEAPESESPDVDVEAPEAEAESPKRSSSSSPSSPEASRPPVGLAEAKPHAPESNSPVSSPPSVGVANAAPTPSPSSGTHVVFSSFHVVVMVLVSSMVGF